ncbi:hypothetical protein ACSBR1_041210 [Camellia fascicularis]
MDVGNNHLEGKIPIELGSLPNLLQLNLVKIDLTGTIPLSLGNLSTLFVLSLTHNNLVGNIAFQLAQLSNLEFLLLSFNNLSGMVPTLLYNISSITFISVTGILLQGSLPSDLGLTLPKQQGFYVASNQFYRPIPSLLANASGLFEINISLNSFTRPLPMNLANLNELQRSVGFGFKSFQGFLAPFHSNLSTKITWFTIDENYLSRSIPPGIGNLVNLGTLGFLNNMLIGSIPDSIGKLSKLGRLALDFNNISGEIPSSIGNLTQLLTLSSQDNMIEGSIPISLGNCSNLLGINLGSNHLTGTIPQQILGNHFEGTILTFFKQLKGLQILDISHNNLSGQIPRELFQATNGFSTANLIGKGGYGSVYKGFLNSSEQIVTMKVLNLHDQGANKSFVAECKALKNIRHQNLVKIITSCSTIDFQGNDFKALVFEIMENGTTTGISNHQQSSSIGIRGTFGYVAPGKQGHHDGTRDDA